MGQPRAVAAPPSPLSWYTTIAWRLGIGKLTRAATRTRIVQSIAPLLLQR
jgi:hypothetical protein